MKWRHWSILIILVLLNYIIFSTAFTQLAKQRRSGTGATRTPQPTFEHIEAGPVAWIVLPTSTSPPTRAPVTPSLEPTITAVVEIAATQPLSMAVNSVATEPPPSTETPIPPTATEEAAGLVHVVQSGETLGEIAGDYNVPVQSLVDANGLANANSITTGQELVIPASAETIAAATTLAQSPPTPTPKPAAAKPTANPPTATPTKAAAAFQFTGEVEWRPLVAANCAGPAISKHSIIVDVSGNPVNGARVEVDCYGNKWQSHPSGSPGEYDAGHYDFAFGQSSPQDWTCTAYVIDVNGQPVASSQSVSIHFDTNDCTPHGSGHQVAIVNWRKHW
jgi:LysM repeat protein